MLTPNTIENRYTLNRNQFEIVKDNLTSFINNFGSVRIESYDNKSFYVYYPANAESHIQYCYSIEYLDGYLYGVVQGVMRGEFKPYRTGVDHPINKWELELSQEG